MNKKTTKILINENQKSFFFDDYIETTHKKIILNKSKIYEDRLYILFSFF